MEKSYALHRHISSPVPHIECNAAYIVAGEAFSGALTNDGVGLIWTSWEPSPTPTVTAIGDSGGLLAGRGIMSLSAGRERMAVVTDDGEVFMWEVGAILYIVSGT
eukprot:scaffold113426_cov36-Prasinocladus_malaysianus.AAC.1